MKRWIWQVGIAITVLSAFLALSLLWFAHHSIVLRLPAGFFPGVVHVEKNDSLVFINLTARPIWPASGPHPNHTNYADFDPLEAIPPGHYWVFTFAEEGAYTFHDHMAPQMQGIVISGTADGISQAQSSDTCQTLTDKAQQASCIEIYFRTVAKSAEYSEARAIYEDIAVRYPDSCHDFAHELGKNAYIAYLKGNLPEIGEEASSCAYGLWHGFTTAMHNDRGFAASKEFCAAMGGANEELQRVNRMNCYHGIGIGLIPDPPDPAVWGKFQTLVEPALAFCDTVEGDPLYNERCLTGVFHAMTNNFANNDYGFILDESLLTHCAAQEKRHQYACFITLASAVPLVTRNDFHRTVTMLQEHSPSHELFLETLKNAAIMSVEAEDSIDELGNFVEQCGAIDEMLRLTCIGAVVNKLYTNGAPGKEYAKASEFCLSTWVRDSEKHACFADGMGYASRMYAQEHLVPVCELIPGQYRSSIPPCT